MLERHHTNTTTKAWVACDNSHQASLVNTRYISSTRGTSLPAGVTERKSHPCMTRPPTSFLWCCAGVCEEWVQRWQVVTRQPRSAASVPPTPADWPSPWETAGTWSFHRPLWPTRGIATVSACWGFWERLLLLLPQWGAMKCFCWGKHFQ